jgi:HD-like signal output (HDOD) protein
MSKQGLDKLIRKENLPTLPCCVQQLNQMLTSDNITVSAVSPVIEKDPALASKVLRLANSSYYGLSSHVNTISRAITILGFNTVRNLVLTVAMVGIFAKHIQTSLDVIGLWYHSLGCAVASQALTCKMAHRLQEKAFICGLIHDIGKVIIAQNVPEDMEKVLKKVKQDPSFIQNDIEQEIIGFTHAEVGEFVTDAWHFPMEYCGAIKFHHNPETEISPLSAGKEEFENEILACGVYAGNHIAKALGLGKSSDEKVRNIPPFVWHKLRISQKELPELLFKIKLDFNSIAESLNDVL